MNSQNDLIEFACPNCGAKFKTAFANGGKRIRCRKCEQPVKVPLGARVEQELDAVLDPASQPMVNPETPLPEPADPLEFDFENVDIDTILADAKRAEEEGARLVEEGKALQARAEQLREESTAKPKRVANPKSPDKAFKTMPARVERGPEVEQVEVSSPHPVEMPAVDGDELLTHVDEIAPMALEDTTDRNVDLGPLQVDGITDDEIDVDDLYGVKCSVCDTRIHITPDKVGSQIECPICFSPVIVNPPSERPRYRPDWNQPKSNSSRDENEAGELRLSEPIQRPKVEHFIEPGFGLPDVETDLLAPLAPRDEQVKATDEIPELQVVEVAKRNASQTPSPNRQRRSTNSSSKANRDSSLPPKPAFSQADSGDGPNSRRARFENSQVDEREKPLSVHSSDDLQPLTIKSLNEHVVGTITDPRLIIPAVTAIIMLTVGDVLYDIFQDLRGPDAEVGFANAIKLIMSGFSFLAIYGCGTLILWYVCSVIFRESARGNHTVESWKTQGFDEIKSTFLLFAFSFALAGLPFLALGTYLSAPIRLLLAPLPLLVAWFNQNVFIGVSFEPFVTFQSQSGDWKQFYIYVFALAVLTLVGGLLFSVPYCSIIAAAVIAVTAIAFAAAAGWHIGRTVKMMDED